MSVKRCGKLVQLNGVLCRAALRAANPIPYGSLKGEVIGVTSYHLVHGENINFAIAADHIKPLLSSDTVIPFQASESSRQENPKPEDERTEYSAEIPKEWIDVEDGNAITVRIEGDYLYEQASLSNTAHFRQGVQEQKFSYLCETKRQRSRWVGKCRYTIQAYWPFLQADQYACSFDLADRFVGSPHFYDPPIYARPGFMPARERDTFNSCSSLFRRARSNASESRQAVIRTSTSTH